MKKDIIIAVAIGFFLGALLAVLLINLPNILKQEDKSQSQNLVTPTAIITSSPEETTFLTVTQPIQNQIVAQNNIPISGKYLAGKNIIIETENEVKTVKTNNDGEFNDKINISEGVNDIYIFTYDNDRGVKTQIVTVFYTTEKL